ncbi:MAG: hypothetical protein DYH15_14735 [Nitrosomonas sp. PRO4]|nr:hypothetical protein [Nitrosomonas sp. PRO4]
MNFKSTNGNLFTKNEYRNKLEVKRQLQFYANPELKSSGYVFFCCFKLDNYLKVLEKNVVIVNYVHVEVLYTNIRYLVFYRRKVKKEN